jgi:transcriptional regulator with XRE-family HTH domain
MLLSVPKRTNDDDGLSRTEAAFSDSVRRLRQEAGLTQAELAHWMREIGVPSASQTTVSRIEAKTRAVRLAEAEVIARIFKRSISAMTEQGGVEDKLANLTAMLERNFKYLDDLKQAARAVGFGQMALPTVTRELISDVRDGEELSEDVQREVSAYLMNADALFKLDVIEVVKAELDTGRRESPFALSENTMPEF